MPIPKRKTPTKAQREERERVDRRNRAIQAIKLPEPKYGAFGGQPKGKAAKA